MLCLYQNRHWYDYKFHYFETFRCIFICVFRFFPFRVFRKGDAVAKLNYVTMGEATKRSVFYSQKFIDILEMLL